jgi:hypothetical protein
MTRPGESEAIQAPCQKEETLPSPYAASSKNTQMSVLSVASFPDCGMFRMVPPMPRP